MDPSQITRLIDSLEVVANVLQKIGPGGVVLLVLAGPALVVIAIMFIEFLRGRMINSMVEMLRAENRTTLAAYQRDTQKLLRELGGNQSATDQYYRDNVELVKQYNRHADGLVDVITSNTRALEQLGTIIRTRIGIGGCE